MSKYDNFVNKSESRKNSEMYSRYRECPIQRDVVLYESFYGQGLTDNPFAIFLKLLEQDVDKKFYHVWVLDDMEMNPQVERFTNKSNVRFVKIGSNDYYLYLATAEYIVINTSLREQFASRTDQKVLQTWHGTPLKTLGKDIKGGKKGAYRNVQRTLMHTDLLINPNQFTEEKIIESHDMVDIANIKTSICGYPRIDLIQNTDVEWYKNNILEKVISVEEGKKIALYAPTWRGTTGDQDDTSEDILKQYELLKDSIPEDYQLLLKVHLNSYRLLLEHGVPNEIFIPNYIDTSELLSVVDLLITDYSSIFFDFYVANKPIVLWLYDKEEYLKERGLYLDLNDVEGFQTSSEAELRKFFNQLDNLDTNWTSKDSSLKWIEFQDRKVSKKVVDKFFYGINSIDTRVINNNRQNTLILMPNLNTTEGQEAVDFILSKEIKESGNNVILFHTHVYKEDDNVKLFELIPKSYKQLFAIGNYNYTRWSWYAVDAYSHGNTVDIFQNDIANFVQGELKRKIGNISIERVINATGNAKHWSVITDLFNLEGKKNV